MGRILSFGWRRTFVLIVLALGFTLALQTSIAWGANPSASLSQCANDPAPSPSTDGCTASGDWVNGNVGASKAVYTEGDTVPYRMLFDNLPTASHTVTIEWDTTKGGKHAVDYLKTFNATVTTADPCLGVSSCGSPTTFAIPKDSQVDDGSGSPITQVAGNFTMYGATIDSVSEYSYADGAGFTGDKSARITITFTATQTNPVLAWGGHISTRADWGADGAAISISGSPYHARLIDLDGSGGNQDRSLSAEAVIFPASITIVKAATPEGPTSFSFTASPSPLGNFSLVDDNTSANTKIFSGITDFKTYSVSENTPAGWALNSIVCAVGSPNGGSQNVTLPGVSISLKEGENVSCTFANQQQTAQLTLVKTVTNDNGGGAVPTDWTLSASGPTPISGTSGSGSVTSATVNAGTYTLSESGGPSGYTGGTYSCVKNGGGAIVSNSISLVGSDVATCTINNNDNPPALHLRKTVTNDNGGTQLETAWTLTATGTGGSPTNLSGSTPVDSSTEFKADTYALGETGPSGYTAGAWDCGAATKPDATHVVVPLGSNVTCTINNNDNAAHLIVIKHVVNDNGGNKVAGDFTTTISGVSTATPSASGVESPGVNNTLTSVGSYSVDEGAHVGYDKTLSADCSGTIALGETKTCTITNDDTPAHLIVIKHVINDNGGGAVAGDFTTTITGVTTATPTAAGAEAPGVNNTLTTVGSYGVDEGAHVGYTKTLSADCSGTIALGETKTCTITNDDQQAYIIVNKTVINDNGGTAVADDFHLTVDGNAVLDEVAFAVNPGTHTAGETNQLDYTAGAWGGDCNTNASVTVALGETKTCTITNNDNAPQLHLRKTVTNDNGGAQLETAWTLTATGTGGSPTNLSGSTPVDSGVTFKADTYALGETGPANYTAGAWDCGQAVMPDTTHVTVPFGGNVTCTINNNDNAAHLIVIKHVVNDNGGGAVAGDFTMTISGVTAVGGNSFAGEETPGVNKTLTSLGAYSVTESGPSGYAESDSADCSGTIALGETKTCTITNNDIAPTLKLVKAVTNNNGGSNQPADWTLTATGTGGFSDTGDSTTFHTVSAGVGYVLSESAVTGYNSEGWLCDGGSLVGNTVTMALDEDVTCTITNNDQAPHLIIIKQVINDNGGSKVAGDFSGTISGVTVTGGNTWTGTVTPGVNKTLTSVGSYGVTENADADYTTTYSADCNGTIALGETKTCTVTNNDKPAHLIVIKHVVNDNGGTKVAGDFSTTISGVSTATPTAAGAESPGVNNELTSVGSYTVDEGAHTGYAKSLSADCSGTIALGETKTCTITNDDISPQLVVIKHVVNDNGGNAVASDFTMNVTATNPSDDSFPGAESPGTNISLDAGNYSVDEGTHTGYTKSLSADCSGTVALGETKTCTITNDDIAPTITLIKAVVNNNGGTAGVNDFGLTVGGAATNSGDVKNVNANTPIALNETGLTGYNFVSLTGDAKCPSVLGGTVSLDEGENLTCTITNDDIPAHLIVIKHVINDNGGTKTAADFTMTITGVTAVGGNSFAGAEAPGVNKTLTSIGSFNITEALLAGYDQTGAVGCTGTIALGETKTCTITNNDVPPPVTRTLGFWQTHFDFTSALFNQTVGNQNWVICNVQPTIRVIHNTNELFGGFYANIAKTTTGVKRSPLDQARMQLLQQLLAAILNHLQFGSGTDAMLSAAKAAYCGTDRNAILAQVTILDNFNNSGDSQPAGVSTGKADPKNSKSTADLATWNLLP